jgi:hypothetical protein
MQKNLIALAVSAALVAPMVAVADTTVFGDMRVRYTQSSEDADDALIGDAIKNDQTNSRIRVGVKSEMDGVKVDLRIKSHDGTHGDSLATIKADYGYMSVPVGPVTVSGGLMVGNFGNRLTYWDTRPNRVALSMPFGDWTGVLTFDKVAEGGYSDDEDNSSMKLILNGKLPMGKAGLMLNSVKKGKNVGDVSGSETILYFAGKLPGDVQLLAEYNSRGGDYYKTVDIMDATEDQQPSALYLHAIKQFGEIDGQLAFAQTASFKADDHFAPFSTVGKSQDTALMDLGGVPANFAAAAGIPADTKLWSSQTIALIGGMNVMPKMRVQVGLGQHTAEIVSGADKGTANIMDLQAVYSAAKNTNITGTYGTVAGNTDFGDYKATMMGVRMETKF